MWPDVAGKFTKFFFEKDEEKKAKMQEEALQVLTEKSSRLPMVANTCVSWTKQNVSFIHLNPVNIDPAS